MAASGSLFTPVRRRYDSSKLSSQFDADGKRVEVETREDEEQGVKMGQTVELLLAAGYFRARIKGLSPFDKVVGGMTWCITTCNFDVNVDLLFQENSTIGQKIALTEKIVAVLPRMMCPHRIEPHQIQGLDFIHIFPVIQWLVKRALETRELMGDYIRSFSISQFNKSHMTPEDKAFEDIKEKSCRTVSDVRAAYKPQRRYCCHDAGLLREEEIRVHSTLLEYGRQYEISREAKPEEDETIAKKAAETAGLAGQKVMSGEDQAEEEEERRLKMLMSGMSAMGTQEGKLSASAVGSIVGMQSAEIHQIASEYADKQAELGQMEKSERVGGLQHHKRLVASLNKQIQQQKSKLEEISTKHSEFHKTYLKMQDTLREIQDQGKLLESEIENLGELESLGNQSILESLRMLVAMNENLKKQEQQFKAHCKEEKTRLTDNVEKLKAETEGDSDDKERMSVIEKQYQADKGKLQKIRLLLAKKNREIAILQRKIDEVPSRAELSQYQRRFIELYNQVGAKYKETKQFYTLYNTLDDKKLHLNKEVNLLNSIYDNFSQAMSSSSTKEQFLRQLEQIVDVVTQNRIKVDKKKQEEKIKRDQLSDQYLELVEKQRLYFKNIKEFQEECRKNEILTSKCRS